MSMYEYRTASFTFPAEQVLAIEPGSARINTLNFSQVPEINDYIDGWEPVSFQVVPLGEVVSIVVLFKTEVSVPGTLHIS